MFKILLPTDGSAFSLQAVDYARKLTKRIADAEVTLLNVVDTMHLPTSLTTPGGSPVEPLAFAPGIATLLEQMDQQSNKILEDARAKLLPCERPVHLQSVRGDPWKQICETAKTEKFDLVIMASIGRGHVAQIIIGSVSDKVLHCSAVPVLIVRGKK